jgi:alkanesulfonate monooxygenase SsuD/methylene tetrahydromethanopterin reductase-like flavin-dependent oxidoreductase (luciferase family)
MGRLQHFGWFFSRGFGPQAWGRDAYRWGYKWYEPALYTQAVRALEQAGLDLVILEDALSLGSSQTIDFRVREAYGGPKLDPISLTPYLIAATSRIGFAPTINPLSYPPYTAARLAATQQHLSSSRFGLNVVTDVGSSRHFGQSALPHDRAYDRATEWLAVVRKLWRSWGEGALIDDIDTWHFADGTKIDAFAHSGEFYDGVTGPLNALPFANGEPIIVSPGGSPRGIGFAGTNSDIQLALAPLDIARVSDYRERVAQAALAAGREPGAIKTLFVFKPELVSSDEEADRIVAASREPSDELLHQALVGQASDLETDLFALDLDKPVDPSIFGDHVSQGSIRGLLAGAESFEDHTLRDLLVRHARKGKIADRTGLVGTAEQVADFIEEFGEYGTDGFIFSGDLHPTTIYRMLGELVPVLRRRGILRTEFGSETLRGNLTDF